MSGLPLTIDVTRAKARFGCGPILLQKSGATGCAVGPFVKSRGFGAPALALFTQLPRYAMHRARIGGGRATKAASRRRF